LKTCIWGIIKMKVFDAWIMIDNSTAFINNINRFYVKHHQTIIYEKKENRITLSTGGYYSLSTIARINKLLKQIDQTFKVTKYDISNENQSLPFHDGMTIVYDKENKTFYEYTE
jgi:Fe-S cluster assembly iron-binding protein IscA